MDHCHWHPDVETLLSCGACGRSTCVDCVRNTGIGTRCFECAGEPPAHHQDQSESDAQRLEDELSAPGALHWVTAFAVGLFSFLVPPLLIIGLWQAWKKDLEHRKRLTVGIALWGGVWLLSQLLIVGTEPGEVLPDYSVGGSTLLLVLSVILIPILLGPAISCSNQIQRRDGLWLSLPLFAGVCAALMLSLAFSLTVFLNAI